MEIFFWVILFLTSVILHEICHGLTAYALGDDTAKSAGRLTLNPLKHLDPFWTVLLPVLLFVSTQGRFMIGMAKPVPVNFLRLRNPKRDMIWVALAGPMANIILATGLRCGLRFYAHEFLLFAIYFNLGLAVFNLIPIPPLDGSKVLAGLLPGPWASRYLAAEPFGFLIILALYFTHALSQWIVPGINLFAHVLNVPRLGLSF